MKKTLITIGVSVLGLMMLWWLGGRETTQTTPEVEGAQEDAVRLPGRSNFQAKPNGLSTNSSNNPGTRYLPSGEIDWKHIEDHRRQEIEKGLHEWRTPIEFYGLVVDDNTNAVEGVQVQFECNDLSSTGTSTYHTESDTNGLFSIKNISGKLLAVKVRKEGYYSYLPHGAFFNYAGENENFVPDPANAVVFRLKKKGVAESLIHVPEFGLRRMVDFLLTGDGKPVEISLIDGKTKPEGQGDFRVEYWAEPPQAGSRKFSWRSRVSIPNGGLQPTSDELPFLAPESGYVPADEYVADPESGAWNDEFQKSFFVRLRDGRYARVRIRVIAATRQPYFGVESYLNPTGSRNLEPADAALSQPR